MGARLGKRLVPEALKKKTGGIGNQSKNRQHSDHSSDKIDLNTQKCSGDLRRLAVTQPPLKTHQVKLM